MGMSYETFEHADISAAFCIAASSLIKYEMTNVAATLLGASVTATGSTQTTATLLSFGLNVVTTTPNGSGVSIKSNATYQGGSPNVVSVINAGANALKVYPPSGQSIWVDGTNQSANTPVSVPVGGAAQFIVLPGQIYQLPIPLSSVIDQQFGDTIGSILYRNSTVWTALGPGSTGQVLEIISGVPSWQTNNSYMQLQWAGGSSVQNDTFYFAYKTPKSGTINSLDYFSGAGSFTVEVAINGTAVTGLSAVDVDSATPANVAATGDNTFTVGATITAIITSVASSPTDALLGLNVTWSS